jgi:hypothetical protein
MLAADEKQRESAEVHLLVSAVHGETNGPVAFLRCGDGAGGEVRVDPHRHSLGRFLSGEDSWWTMSVEARPNGRLSQPQRSAVLLRGSTADAFIGPCAPPTLVMEQLDGAFVAVWALDRKVSADEGRNLAISLAERLPGTDEVDWIELPRGSDLQASTPHRPGEFVSALRPDLSSAAPLRQSPDGLLEPSSGPALPPVGWTLEQDLMVEPAELEWAVTDLLPAGGNALLVAAAKAGKTTLAANLIRCAADDELFLGEHAVSLDGRVGYLNYEVSHQQHLRWLRDLGLVATDRVVVAPLRHRRALLQDDAFADELAEWCLGNEVDLLVVDPLVNTHEGDENSNSEMSRLTRAIDRIKADSGIRNAVVVHHAGHVADRSRGASSLIGWADSLWNLRRDGAASAVFGAEGRDVHIQDRTLEYDPRTRRLTYGAARTAPAVKEDPLQRLKKETLRVVGESPGISGKDLRRRVRGNDADKNNAKSELIAAGLIDVKSVGTARLHFPAAHGSSDA